MKEEDLLPQDTALLVTISHSKPVEMSDLIKTLNGLGNAFDAYCRLNGDNSGQRKAKLYVEKIEHGSIDIILTEMLTVGMLPLLTDCNVILEFAGYVKSIFGYFAHNKGRRPEMSKSEYRSFKDILSTVVHDNHGEIRFGAISRDNAKVIFKDCTINYIQGNAAQNVIEDAISNTEDATSDSIHRRVLLKFDQVRSNISSNSGNKASIDTLFDGKSLAVIFQDDDLKREILKDEHNPINKAFFVDVEVSTIGGKPVAYKIIALHEIIDLDD